MNILLYSPDNGVTRNFMPHLWMFLLKALTPAGHRVFLIDGNAQPMTEDELAQFVRANDIQLAGISATTRMAARAYRMADAIRSTGAKVVFGGHMSARFRTNRLGVAMNHGTPMRLLWGKRTTRGRVLSRTLPQEISEKFMRRLMRMDAR